ncbi:hypothetical protein [Pseudomonas sp. RT6P73]
MDWLIDQNIAFTAVVRSAERTQEMMAQRVVRLESATYEIIEVDHTVESLTQAFRGAKVVCNTVSPSPSERTDRSMRLFISNSWNTARGTRYAARLYEARGDHCNLICAVFLFNISGTFVQ